MALFLLLLPAFAQDDVLGEPAPVEEVADTGDSGVEEPAAEPLPVKVRRSGKKKRDRSGEESGRDRWYMAAIVGLLVLWLSLRLLQPAARKRPARAERPSPVADDELGRMVYTAIQHADLHEYRELFLTGGEARQVMGSDALVYVERMSPEAVEDALVDVSVFVSEHAMYAGTERDGEMLSLIVKDPQGTTRSVEVGTTARVGGVLRLVDPA
ncbi:MAG: hypothetical protein GY913_02275 [Proteobacteria bacterium]|nr:hypothetical protein [Pseudomonadota bacterium]MCP4915726.1 hypothetical protein [Pseudomonadota bacterium]